jgi:hypothetical protein
MSDASTSDEWTAADLRKAAKEHRSADILDAMRSGLLKNVVWHEGAEPDEF